MNHPAEGGFRTFAPDGQKRLRVLIAEDNRVNQHLAVRLLEKHGGTVVLANDGGKPSIRAKELFEVVKPKEQPRMGDPGASWRCQRYRVACMCPGVVARAVAVVGRVADPRGGAAHDGGAAYHIR